MVADFMILLINFLTNICRGFPVIAAMLCLTLSFPSFADEQKIYHAKDFTNHAKLQGLNKVTARVSEMSLEVGEVKKFSNIEVALEKCWHSPPEEKPENKALLKIWEQVPGEDKKQIFHGWMFSSTPAISALEHPVYDVTLLSCYNTEPAPENSSN